MSSHHGHEHHDIGPPILDEVSDGVFAYVQPDGTWWINNTGFIVADDGVIAIDTCSTERRTRAFLDTVASVTDAPLRTVVNTHHHGDHTHGNYLTHPATIVGHERCREHINATGILPLDGVFSPVDWGDLEAVPPMLTFTDTVNLYAGDLKIELHHLHTAAHTDNDVVAWLPERKVLYAGDLVFNGGTPFVLMGSVTGSLTAIERLKTFDADVIVPGHGPVCDPSVFETLERYYRFVLDVATEAHSTGTSPLDAARQTDLGEFADLSDSERLVGNLHRALFEMAGNDEGAPIDVFAAIGDMITFNNGQPLRCLA